MEEVGTEIVLQPGSNLLQCCVTEPAEDIAEEVLPSPCSETGDVEQDECSPITEESHTEELSTEEEEREESATPRGLVEPAEEHPEVNRHDSLIETESADEEEQLFMSEVRDESPDMYDEYPAAVDVSEGQEAVWHEDEYSTVESVYCVKPEKENKLRGMLSGRKMRVPFFRRGKKVQKRKPVEAVEEHGPEQIQESADDKKSDEDVQEFEQYEEAIELERVRTNFIKCSLDEDNNDEGDKVEDDEIEDDEEGTLYSNAIDLTDAPNTIGMVDAPKEVKMPDASDSKESTDSTNTVEISDVSEEKELIDAPNAEPTEAPVELTEAPVELIEAPVELIDAANSIEFTSTIDRTTMDDDETVPQATDLVLDYAARAMNYIESILPKNSSSDDGTISTLGLKNDTEEYDLDTATYDTYRTPEISRITDIASLSSLNDILDGNGSVADKKRTQVEKYAVPDEEQDVQEQSDPSPPTDVEETEVPEEKGPEVTASATSKNEEPALVSLNVPTQLNLVLDDRYEPAHVDEQSNGEDSERSDRYTMVEEDDNIKLKLSVSAGKEDENGGLDDDEMSEDLNRLQSASFDQMCDDIVENEKARTDMSPTNVDNSGEDRYQTGPNGETPRRGGVDLEENTEKEIDVDEQEVKEEDMVLTNEEPGDEKSEREEAQPKEASNVETPCENEQAIEDEAQVSTTENIGVAETKNDEETEAIKKEIVESDEKPNMIEQMKRKPLVPNSVVEEKYLVDKTMKKISTGKTPTNKWKKMKRDKKKRLSLTSKRTATATQKAVSEVKKNPSSTPTVFDDSNTVVEQAMSNGALKANESNLEGDDIATTNYLAAALKKQKARYTDMGEVIDDDSYVAAIRGPQTKEAPGVALDADKNLDPGMANVNDEVVTDLAPTPRLARKPNVFQNAEKLAEEKALEIAREREEERQRRKMITERLFKAGLDDEVTKEPSEDALKTIPTAATCESYSDEPVPEDAEKKEIKAVKGRRKLAISFLKRK